MKWSNLTQSQKEEVNIIALENDWNGDEILNYIHDRYECTKKGCETLVYCDDFVRQDKMCYDCLDRWDSNDFD